MPTGRFTLPPVPETYGDEPPPVDLGPAPLDYVDNFLGSTKPTAKPKTSGNTKVYAGAAAGAAVLIGLIALAVGVFSGGDSPETDENPGASSEWCPSRKSDKLVMGAGKGSQDDGPSVILAFDYAYYVERDGAKAHSLLDPADPASLTAESLQNAIDTAIPDGTQHCLSIKPDPAAPGRYAVQLSERRGDGTAVVYKQNVSTANHGGKHVITSIEAAE
ncbi:hypothetical protein [Aldersonia kunmingensis]|uniref:hypothetical protein n=1 Tax=Aldersonia kunmingensis TaxID=408066 RepID=UPI0012ED4D6A|nr:hypothetical protein [Aldersonia kunmingensis]